MTTSTLLTLVIILFTIALLTWFIYSLIWGKPWSINLLYARTFLRIAIDGPELLTVLGILEKLGIHFHNARFSDVSVAHETKELERIKRDLAILRSYDRSRQSKKQLLSTDIMDWFLEDNATRAEPFRFHDYPINQMFGIQSQMLNFMMTIHPVVNKIEAHNYIKRLSKFSVKFDQVMEGLVIREQKGIIPPRFVVHHVIDEMGTFIGHPTCENPLYTVFAEKLAKLEKIGAGDRQNLLDDAAVEIERTVYPTFQKLIDYFTTLEAKATDDDGVWKLPNGDAYYAHCLHSNTSTNYTPEQVHEIGLQEVARIENEMKAILEELNYTNVETPTKKLAELAQEERFLYPNNDEGRAAVLTEYQRILDEVNAALDPYFDIRPKANLKVERVPKFMEKTAALAYYYLGDLTGGRPGVFYVNLRNTKEIYQFGMKTIAYHEGIPGHHFQIAISQKLKGIPFFRRLIPFTAYAEGWALYAERLAAEMGLYKDDPYGDLGRLDAELFRAVRLVVDTGIHHQRWTREQAIEYMQAHSAQAHESVVSEIERYIVMPGQACAYKIGMIKILELREKAKQALGEKFDLRQFHNAVLKNGSMPLSILERVVDDYIQTAKVR